MGIPQIVFNVTKSHVPKVRHSGILHPNCTCCITCNRVLRVHENVMAVMMNTLGRRAQAQSDAQPSGQPAEEGGKEKVSLRGRYVSSRLSS